MPEMVVLVAGFVLGVMAGIYIGWSAAPAVVWQVRQGRPEPAKAPEAVGMTGGL
jgi:hypothetical protein